MAYRDIVWVIFHGRGQLYPWFLGKFWLSPIRKTCHDAPMAKHKRLLDIYRFPGFVPLAKVKGIFGDPLAVVITLQRRRKKRFVESADMPAAPITTSDHGASATWPVATSACTSFSPFAESSVSRAAA